MNADQKWLTPLLPSTYVPHALLSDGSFGVRPATTRCAAHRFRGHTVSIGTGPCRDRTADYTAQGRRLRGVPVAFRLAQARMRMSMQAVKARGRPRRGKLQEVPRGTQRAAPMPFGTPLRATNRKRQLVFVPRRGAPKGTGQAR